MNMNFPARVLAVLGGFSAIVMPSEGQAGNVGYYLNGSGSCTSSMGDYAARITAAGHTPVAVSTLDAGSLAPLNGLVIAQGCNAYTGSAAVNTAVSNGLRVFIEVQHVFAGDGAYLPGTPALAITSYHAGGTCYPDADLASGSPIATGPGGTLTDDSLDSSVYCTPMGWASSSSLPAGSTPLLIANSNVNQVAAFSYAYGNGRVVYSQDQYFYFLSGGYDPGTIVGSDAYVTNTIAWLMSTGPTTTCASEGYTGTKLQWCKYICESELSSSQIDVYLRRWINRYHDLPYCAREEEPEMPPQEG
ncbi:MAG: hypothetical protein IPH90_04105 [Thermomonas sp.]|jgi:hypothetical protein|uniref:hypothetical protein n=1 Tax=Thermomonas sp. TaxID=1971895 RepID=UPI0025CF47F5|nr:hypothetical protein [Thermomonas sp.]MBK6925429.1 hypothetical protein [Thermomonas sp.]MBK7205213.1 hypothetical protein [Thermomonas sp.]HRA03189.1 hypothetical protein [Thermomonas sp.]